MSENKTEQAATIIGYLDRHHPGGNQTYADIRDSATEAVKADPNSVRWLKEGANLEPDQIVHYCLHRLQPTTETNGQPQTPQ